MAHGEEAFATDTHSRAARSPLHWSSLGVGRHLQVKRERVNGSAQAGKRRDKNEPARKVQTAGARKRSLLELRGIICNESEAAERE